MCVFASLGTQPTDIGAFCKAWIDAARERHTQFVLKSSVVNAILRGTEFAAQHTDSDAYLAQSGIPYSFCRPTLLMSAPANQTANVLATGKLYQARIVVFVCPLYCDCVCVCCINVSLRCVVLCVCVCVCVCACAHASIMWGQLRSIFAFSRASQGFGSGKISLVDPRDVGDVYAKIVMHSADYVGKAYAFVVCACFFACVCVCVCVCACLGCECLSAVSVRVECLCVYSSPVSAST